MSRRRRTRSPRLLRRTWHRIALGAEHEATAAGHRRVGSEHVLTALVSVGDGRGATWLRSQGLEAAEVRAFVRRELDRRGGDPHGVDPRDLEELGLAPATALASAPLPPRRRWFWSPDGAAVVHTASETARRVGRRAPTDDDVLLGILDTRSCRARGTLVRLGVDLDRLRATLRGEPPPTAVGVR